MVLEEWEKNGRRMGEFGIYVGFSRSYMDLNVGFTMAFMRFDASFPYGFHMASCQLFYEFTHVEKHQGDGMRERLG